MIAAEPTPEVIISLRNVSLSYWVRAGRVRRRPIEPLKNIDLDIYARESVGIIGRNGCGKTTLLRILAGVMSADRGTVYLRPGLRAAILSLQLGFIDALSGRKNAMLGGLLLGMPRAEIEKLLPAVAEFAALDDFFDLPLSTYSAGMRARLGFALSIHLNPDVLLIDETLGVGDADFRQKSFSLIRDRLRSREHTVVLASHELAQVSALCDRALWIEDGVVKAAGAPGETIAAYQESVWLRHFEDVVRKSAAGGKVFIRRTGAPAIYIIEGGRMSKLSSHAEFLERGGRGDIVTEVSEARLEELTQRFAGPK